MGRSPILRGGRRGWAITISGTVVGANIAHVGSAEAHSSDERRSGRGLSGPKERIVVFNGVLVNRVGIVRVGRHAAPSDEGRSVGGRGAREAKGGD